MVVRDDYEQCLYTTMSDYTGLVDHLPKHTWDITIGAYGCIERHLYTTTSNYRPLIDPQQKSLWYILVVLAVDWNDVCRPL